VGRRSIPGLALLLLGAAPAFAQVVNPANGHTYWLTPITGTFSQGRAIADAAGGVLACVTDAAEQDWIYTQVLSNVSGAWIGLTDEVTEGTFLWESGEAFVYENWAAGNPTSSPLSSGRDYVRLDTFQGGEWVDLVDGTASAALIEYDDAPSPAVLDLDQAHPTPDGSTISWQNPVPYDSIEVFRGSMLVATLPGTATEYWVPAAGPEEDALWVIGRVAGSPSLPSGIVPYWIDSRFRLSIPPAILAGVDPGEVRVVLGNDLPLVAWAYGVCHDESIVELLGVAPGSATAGVGAGAPHGFYSLQTFPNGFTAEMIVDFLGITDLAAGDDQELEVATYRALAPADATTELHFCGDLFPPNPTYSIGPPVVIPAIGDLISLAPEATSGMLELRRRRFIRADANGDLAVDVADPIFLGAYLFGGGAAPPCKAAGDSNGDLALDVADMVHILSHLFSGGASPGAPFPDCGEEPAPGLECAAPPLCP